MERAIRILCLEDNSSDIELLKRLLKRGGLAFELGSAGSQSSFLRAFQEESFDLIVMDHNVPGWDGSAALEFVRQHSPDIPVVFFTGTIGEEAAVELLRNGATDYVLKDRPTRLVPAIRQALKEARLKKAHTEVEARLKQHAMLLEKARDAIYLLNLQREILYWNKGAELIFGRSAKEVLGKKLEVVFPGEIAPLQEAFSRTLETGDWLGELEQVSRKEKRMILESHWSLMADGLPKSVLAVNTDITEKKRIEENFFRAQRLEGLGALAGGIAHDLNNVLTPIITASELLRLVVHDHEGKQWLNSLHASAQHGAELIRQILSFARGTSGKETEVQLRYLIDDVVAMLRQTFPPEVRINVETQRNLWPMLANATKVQQVLMNLCVNAKDAMPTGGRILITSRNLPGPDAASKFFPEMAGKDWVPLTISDTGHGIPAEQMDKLFDPFFTTKENGKGTGLGLATVQCIVKSFGGFLKVESREGIGTHFHVFFPALHDAPLPHDQTVSRPTLPHGHEELVLFVDDAAAIRETSQAILEHHGFRVATAIDGQDGLVAFVRVVDQLKLVVADVVMPVMDGIELAKAIWKLKPEMPVLLLSAKHETSILQRLPPSAPVAFLEKPFSIENLVMSVHSMVRKDAAPAALASLVTKPARSLG